MRAQKTKTNVKPREKKRTTKFIEKEKHKQI